MKTERVAIDQGRTITAAFTVDEAPADADGGVAVTVVDAAGATVQQGDAALTATTGTYEFTLGPLADVDRLVVSWAGVFSGVAQTVRTRVEIVGGHFFTIAELRSAAGAVLSDTARYTTAGLLKVRSVVENRIEEFCDVAFVPRFGVESVVDAAGNRLILDTQRIRRVLWCTVDGAALTAAQIADLTVHSWGAIDRPAYWVGDVVVGFEHGYDFPPDDLVDAALVAARHIATSERSGMDARTLSQATEMGGTVRYSQPGEKRCFGLPDVDAVIASHSHDGPFVG